MGSAGWFGGGAPLEDDDAARDLFGDVSTQDDGQRSALDFYETSGWMTRSLLANHPKIAGSRVLECCAGRGAITRELRKVGCYVVENDLNPQHHSQLMMDATKPHFWEVMKGEFAPIDYVITNLAFNVAIDILRVGVWFPRVAFITVLLKSFDEPTEDRGPWLAANPWTRKICQPRHSFRGTGSPSMASDWFIWERDRDTTLAPCIVDALAKSR